MGCLAGVGTVLKLLDMQPLNLGSQGGDLRGGGGMGRVLEDRSAKGSRFRKLHPLHDLSVKDRHAERRGHVANVSPQNRI